MCLLCKAREHCTLAEYFEFLDRLGEAAKYGAEHDFFIAFVAHLRKGGTMRDALAEGVNTYEVDVALKEAS